MQVKEGKVQAAPGLSTGLRISHPVCLRDTISLPRGVIDQTSPQQCSSQQPGPFSPEIRVNLSGVDKTGRRSRRRRISRCRPGETGGEDI